MNSKLINKLFCVFTVMAAFFGSSLAAYAESTTADFNGEDLPKGWAMVGSNINHNNDRHRDSSDKGKSVWSNGKTDTDDYLITEAIEGTLTFYWRTYNTSGTSSNGRVTVYEYGTAALGNQLHQTTFEKTSTWQQVTVNLGAYRGRVAIALNFACIDDVTYTPYVPSADADLVIQNYANGSTFDFGAVVAGTTKSFMLGNAGQSVLNISKISVTGGYTITSGGDLTTIAAGKRATLIIATPETDAEGALTIESNDPKGAYVVNLKSTYKIPAPVMVVNPVKVVFGQVEADATQEITVRNTGDAELTATIASDNTDFTVSAASLTVAAGASDKFTVTYHYRAEAVGGQAANITLTPNAGEAVVISASAYIKDPNAWSEDFSGNALPDGWAQVGSSWTFTSGEAVGSYDPNGWLVTPRLTVKAGEQLTFQARSKQYGTDLIVQYQKNGGEWTQQMKVGFSGATEYKTYTISGLEPGTYRFRFASENICLDNFEGFTLASSTAVKETWHISYTFHYNDATGEGSEEGTEDIEVEFDGDKVGFNFPNPINGNAWMYGTRYEQDNIVYYIFPMGQYVGQYGGESIYFCGGANETLTDMQFFYNDDDKAFFNFEHVLLNGSTTAISLWGYFSDVVIYKNEKPVIEPAGIESLTPDPSPKGEESRYNLRGQKVDSSYKGIVIQNGKKYLRR